jgi:vancomycin resistance protein YoaR
VDATLEKVFSIGRQGNIIERLNQIFNVNFSEESISPEISYDEEKIQDIAEAFYEKNFIPVRNPSIIVNDNAAIINSGHHGESIDKDYLVSEIKNFIKNRNISRIDVPIIITEKEKINPDDYYNFICKNPVNATARVTNNVLEIIPHEIGQQIDRDLLNAAIKDVNNGENIVKTLPITLIEPEITSEKLNDNLFRDVLATYKTYFLTDSLYNINRNENLRIAVECINGTILAPGDIFSFDKTLGERTEEKGYKPAKVFWGGEIIDSVGGGICQVSSTLYNTVLRADLDVLERHNHSFLVSYIPIGMDAAVAYQSIDFKFRNSSSWPIKIVGMMTGSKELIFTILGTNENSGKSVEFYTQIINTTNYNTIYIDDPSIPEGKAIVTQEGINGYVVDTYKIVKQDGNEISRYKLNTSVYIPLNREVLRGIKKEQPLQELPEQPSEQLTEEENGQQSVQETAITSEQQPEQQTLDTPIPNQQTHDKSIEEPYNGNQTEEPADISSYDLQLQEGYPVDSSENDSDYDAVQAD